MSSRFWQATDGRRRIRRLLCRVAPAVAFLVVLGVQWRITDLSHGAPAYGDVLEVIWGTEVYRTRVGEADFPRVNDVFQPEGWHLGTFAYGLATFATAVPFSWLGGDVWAYNLATLLSLVAAFAGMYWLARRFSGRFPATVAALMFTFWGFRWLRIMGALNLALGSAALPWLLLALGKSRKRRAWLLVVSLAWAYAIANSLYFAWIGGLVVAVWAVTLPASWRRRVQAFGLPVLATILLSAPSLLYYVQGSRAAGVASYTLGHMNDNGANLNALPAPFVYHPQLADLTARLYQGPIDPSGTANFGLLAGLVGLVGLPLAWRRRETRYLVPLVLLALLLALGPTLKWNGESIQVGWLSPLNTLLWRVGHWLKPGLFVDPVPPEPFGAALSLPWLWLATFVPFWEGARIAARFAFAAALAFFPLVAISLERLKPAWIALPLALALVWETVSFPALPVPYPPPGHPAFDWLRGQAEPGATIVDLTSPLPDVLNLAIRGETLYATALHGHPTVAGASSVWPAHTRFLLEWFWAHPRPQEQPDFVPLLRGYGVRYVVLHQDGGGQWLDALGAVPELALTSCFDPPPDPSPWPWEICIFELAPEEAAATNLHLLTGWSAPESWGVWAEGTESRTRWLATAVADYRLQVEVFPFCVAGQEQSLDIALNDVSLRSLTWNDCGPQAVDVTLPADLTRVGWNDLVFRTAYAVQPAVLTGGANPDTRALSVGYNRLWVHR